MMIAEKFDRESPPKIYLDGEQIVLQFKSLPPANQPINPIYDRLEVIINNTIGYQYKINKSSNRLTFYISSNKQEIQIQIQELLNRFHEDVEFLRFNGINKFMTSNEVSHQLGQFLTKELCEVGKIKTTNKKVEIYIGEYQLILSWNFLRGDASKEFGFNWTLNSKELANLHNHIMQNSRFKPVKYLNLIYESQEYDRREEIPKYFDVANNGEIEKAVKLYVTYLDKSILSYLRRNLNHKKLLNLIAYRQELKFTRFPERDLYRKLLIATQISSNELEKLIGVVKVERLQSKDERDKIKLLISKKRELITCDEE